MKTKLFLVVILISLTTIAQTDTKTYHDQMQVLLSQLDSTRFKNNTLYDRVYPLANLKQFNQNGRKDTSDYKHFYQAVHELHLAGNKQSIASVDRIRQAATSAKFKNQVLVGIINMDISTIKQDAFDENDSKMRIDSTGQDRKLLEITDKEPYKHIQSLVISPLQGKIRQETGSAVTFNFLQGMTQKSTNPIKTLSVDFGNGQNHPIIENRGFTNMSLSHTFPAAGNYILKLSGSYQDGGSFETYARIAIVITPYDPYAIKHIRATETFTPYIPDTDKPSTGFITNYTDTETGEYISELPKIEYKYFYSTKEPVSTKIRKPIIITDGIDYAGNDERDIHHIYHEDLKLFDTANKLGDKLRELGYDVIIVDFPTYKIGKHSFAIPTNWSTQGQPIEWEVVTVDVPRQGGADYIQRNAQVLKQLIRHVNNKLVANGSDEELIVVGPSMGGMVTRWALKEMEDAGENHKTRLWVAFDAPHQGANGVIGLQFGANYTNNVELTDPLSRSASKQMLVFHVYNECNNTVYGGAPQFRNQFTSDLASLGYPQNLRKVALVNGSSTGELNNSPNGLIVNTYITVHHWFWGYFFYNNYIRLTQNSGTQKVFDLDQPWLLNQGGGDGADVFKYVVNNSQIGSVDTAPGSKFPLPLGTLDKEDEYWKGNFHVWKNTVQLLENPTFMPTKSALDFQGSNKKLRDPICYDLVAAGETPFDGYYAPNENEPHVQLNSANVAWILKEINGEEPPPVYGCCTMPQIIGDNSICTNETKTYHLNSSCLGAVTWSVSSNLTMGTPTGNQVEVTSTNSNNIAWIKANFDNGGSVSKNLVGEPYYELYDSGEFFHIRKVEGGIPLSQQGISNIVWVTDTGFIDEDPYPNNYHVSYYGQVSGYVDVYNSCGKTREYFNISGNNTNNCENPNYIIESLGQDKYKLVDTCDPINIQYVDSSELYNQYGIKIQDLIPQQDEVDMSNTSYSGEIRIIMFVKDGQVFTKTVIAD